MIKLFLKNPNYPDEIVLKETENWRVSLWSNQYNLGRASIEYKDMKVRHLRDLPDEHAKELFMLIKLYENALMKSFKPVNFNWTCLMNASYRQEKEFLHLHCWPRYDKEIEFSGEVFTDEHFAHHYNDDGKKEVSEDVLIKIGNEIAKFL